LVAEAGARKPDENPVGGAIPWLAVGGLNPEIVYLFCSDGCSIGVDPGSVFNTGEACFSAGALIG